MDTPAGPDPDINIGGEETGIEIRDALLGLRTEMRAMHQHLTVELDEMLRIPMMADRHSDRSRPAIPIQGGQGFQRSRPGSSSAW
jgi:hypothetical protein